MGTHEFWNLFIFWLKDIFFNYCSISVRRPIPHWHVA